MPTYTYDIAEMLARDWMIGSRRASALDGLGAGRLVGWHSGYAGNDLAGNAQWALDRCRDAGISLKGRTVGALKLSEMTNWDRAPTRLFRAIHRQI